MKGLIWEGCSESKAMERSPTSLMDAIHARKLADVEAFLDHSEAKLEKRSPISYRSMPVRCT